MLVCERCGSERVMQDCVIDVNNPQNIGYLDSFWCEDCQDETLPVSEEGFLSSQNGECAC